MRYNKLKLTEDVAKSNPYVCEAVTWLNNHEGSYAYVCSARLDKQKKEIHVGKGFMNNKDFNDFIKDLNNLFHPIHISTMFQGQQSAYYDVYMKEDESLTEEIKDKRSIGEIVDDIINKGKKEECLKEPIKEDISEKSIQTKLGDINPYDGEVDIKINDCYLFLNFGYFKENFKEYVSGHNTEKIVYPSRDNFDGEGTDVEGECVAEFTGDSSLFADCDSFVFVDEHGNEIDQLQFYNSLGLTLDESKNFIKDLLNKYKEDILQAYKIYTEYNACELIDSEVKDGYNPW